MIGVDYRIVPDVSRETSALVAVNSKFDPDYMIAIGGYIGEDRVIEIIIAMTDLPMPQPDHSRVVRSGGTRAHGTRIEKTGHCRC